MPTKNTSTTQQLNKIKEFRQTIYRQILTKSRDAQFELIDALMQSGKIGCFAELSMKLVFRRRHTVKEVHLSNAEQPNLWVNITDVFDTKIEAILCHTSQVKEPENLRTRLTDRSKAIDEYGNEVFREGFRVMRIG